MRSGADAAWWERLLFALGAMILTLALAIALRVARDFLHDPDFHWSNGGESQIFGVELVAGGLVVIATYVLFVIPVVLLWPVETQRSRWYKMLCAATLWPFLLRALVFRERPSVFIQDVYHSPAFYAQMVLFALCASGGYLLLIRWIHAHRIRLVPPDSGALQPCNERLDAGS